VTLRDLRIARVEHRAGGALDAVIAIGSDGSVGEAPCVCDPAVAKALVELVPRWIGADPLAFEARWRALGAACFGDPAHRAAFGAIEFACAHLVANAARIPMSALSGQAIEGDRPNARSSAPGLPDDELSVDADTFASLAQIGRAGLERDATSLRYAPLRSGGPVGLRALAALARALNLEAQAHRATLSPPALAAPRAARIRRIRLHQVKLPLARPYVSAMYLTDTALRTIVELETDDGIVGLGETHGAEEVFRLTAALAKTWIGESAFERRALASRFACTIYENRNGRNGWQALAGVEVAAWDNLARRLDVPLARLLGGGNEVQSLRVVSLLPTAMLDRVVPRAALAELFGDTRNVAPVAEHAAQLHAGPGFTSFKYKSSGLGLEWDVAAIQALRERLGREVEIRFDPNAAYDTATALAVCRALEPFAVTWYEDPTGGIEGLARVRKRVSRPIATNMAVVQFDHLAPAARRGAVDVVLGDTCYWGGVEAIRDLALACDALGLSLANHAFYETQVSGAVNLHLAGGLGLTAHAHDQAFDGLADDVVAPETLAIRNGHVAVPAGPGIGIALDRERLARLRVAEVVLE
jgi:glucarate dehydratase